MYQYVRFVTVWAVCPKCDECPKCPFLSTSLDNSDISVIPPKADIQDNSDISDKGDKVVQIGHLRHFGQKGHFRHNGQIRHVRHVRHAYPRPRSRRILALESLRNFSLFLWFQEMLKAPTNGRGLPVCSDAVLCHPGQLLHVQRVQVSHLGQLAGGDAVFQGLHRCSVQHAPRLHHG